MLSDEGQDLALPQEQSPTPAGQSNGLKLINVGPSADGKHVDVHFVTTANHVTSVQLDVTSATNFCSLLGDAIGRIQSVQPRLQPRQLN